MSKESEKKKPVKKKITLLTMAISLPIVFVVVIGVLSFLIYKADSDSAVLRSIEEKLPFPAASVGGWHFVYIGDVKQNLSSVKQFYESQDFDSVGVRIDFSTTEGQKRLKVKEKEILNKMIEDKVIEILAKKRDILITDKMVEENVLRRLESAQDLESIKSSLMQLYGWGLKDFENKVVKPGLYKDRLEEYVLKNELKEENASAKKKASDAREKLNSGDDFLDVADSFSEGESASRNGDLGWFKKKYLSKNLSEKVFEMEVGEVSGIIESDIGFHIIRLDDKKTENGEMVVKLSQVFIQKKTFSTWIEQEIEDMKIRVFMRPYSWNHEKLISEFKDEEMRKFEKSLLSN